MDATAPRYLLLVLLGVVGCGQTPAHGPPEEAVSPAASGTRFDATTVGRIEGQVVWEGDAPVVPAIETWPFFSLPRPATWDHPHRPLIDNGTRGVGNAVVFLRGIDPQVGRPWDQPPVEVEFAEHQLTVRQGPRVGAFGFVRQGGNLRVVSRQPCLHTLHADGAAFFTLSLPEQNQWRSRPLYERGVVELSSTLGFIWMRGHLFVDAHPYYCCTNREGRFALEQVPPGRYELVCWLPNWREERRTLDTESARPTKLYFKPPVERMQSVTVAQGGDCIVRFALSTADFK